ncbi:MAG: DNA-directed RNA polymerase subunit omega [Bacteroidales bacterium]|nr:DNA-directed RNA polymerase subunit omega [Bacteroidales bacterium]
MDYKKTNAPTNTVTCDIMDFCKETGNIYESVAIIAKRSNQIAADLKTELHTKLQSYSEQNNKEQIELSRYYERLPKPTLIATQEFKEGDVYHRNPAREKDKFDL